MKIRTDYHFHPNLPRNIKRADKKCKYIWEQLAQKGIHVVLVTEHAYKNPKRAFEYMRRHKPDSLYCFPWVECISQEGVDIVVFSDSEKIYDYKELQSFWLPYRDIIDFVNSKDDLSAYVTHPHTLWLAWVIKKLGYDAYQESSQKLGAVEISNGGLDNVYIFIEKFWLKKIFKNLSHKINKVKLLPRNDYPSTIIFLAAGSDAHYPEEIGNCYEIEVDVPIIQEDAIFAFIKNNQGRWKVYIDTSKKFSSVLLIKTAFTAFEEFCTAKRKKIIKHFSNRKIVS